MQELELSTQSKNIQKGTYQHYKGKLYTVLYIARLESTLEELVIYRAEYGDHSIWARPVTIFLEEVEYQNTKVPRFRFLEPHN